MLLEDYLHLGGILKSNASDYLELVQSVYIDACAKCPAEVSDLRDLMTIRSRVKEEGLSFLTITLPQFCKDFESALQAEQIGPQHFLGFRKCRAIPAFLRGMLGQIFDRETGRIKYERFTSTYVEAVRQVCLLFKKVELPCTPAREWKAVQNFILVEQLNRDFQLRSELRDKFLEVSDCLWHNMLGDLRLDMLVPRHGPGATAERISGNQKFVWRRWHERLEPYFPFFGTAYSMGATDDWRKVIKKVTFVPEEEEQPVRVTLVPKTLKTPRIIAIEPVCMQYAQQAIQACLYDRIESYWLTRGHVNFRDQTVNQELALISSATGQKATIDLSDASDRVLADLALEMFNSNLDFRDAVNACRSTGASLPDGTLVSPLAKFASMGSALCFPIEAMYFYTICVVSLLEKYDLPVSPINCFNVSRGVFVYGDDIIVNAEDAGAILDYLQKYHCKVNSAKTFVTGKFRESCGTDAFDGQEVTPTYLRHLRPENRQQAKELISWIATANIFYKKGYWRTAELMFRTCERILGSLPYVSPDSPALGRVSFLGYRSASGWNDDLQVLQQRAWVPKIVYSCDSVDGYSALQKVLLSAERREYNSGQTPLWGTSDVESVLAGVLPASVDKQHLERSALRGAVTLKRRWVPIT